MISKGDNGNDNMIHGCQLIVSIYSIFYLSINSLFPTLIFFIVLPYFSLFCQTHPYICRHTIRFINNRKGGGIDRKNCISLSTKDSHYIFRYDTNLFPNYIICFFLFSLLIIIKYYVLFCLYHITRTYTNI